MLRSLTFRSINCFEVNTRRDLIDRYNFPNVWLRTRPNGRAAIEQFDEPLSKALTLRATPARWLLLPSGIVKAVKRIGHSSAPHCNPLLIDLVDLLGNARTHSNGIRPRRKQQLFRVVSGPT